MPPNKPRLFLVSNMFPSKSDKRFGVFVENFSYSIESDFIVKKYALTKHKMVLKKSFAYLMLYIRLFFLPFLLRKKDVIYIHFPLYFSPLLHWWFLFTKNIVLNFHGGDAYFDNTLRKILGFFLKPIVKKCKVVVPSKSFSKRIEKLFSIEKVRIHVYPSGGINTLVFKPINTKKEVFTIGFVSSLIQPKGWKVFLEAINLLKKKNKDAFKVIMLGEGSDKNKIDRYIVEHKLPVELLQNRDQKDLAIVYNRFHVFVFPTKKESLGLVGLEAMACGTPVIASDVPGPNDYVKHNFNGLLFEENNPQELFRQLEYYRSLNEAERQVFIDNSLETSKAFDSNIVKVELINFIQC